MSRSRERFREILRGPGCTPVAPIFDPLSARIADILGWEVIKLTGSARKAASLAVPDDAPLANMSDLVDACAHITRLADLSLVVDADCGGGNALTVFRTVQELEGAGASAIELEDCIGGIGPSEGSRGSRLVSVDEHVGKLQAAVAARRDPTTVIVARTRAVAELPLAEALDRIRAYAQTGAEAIYLYGHLPRGRADIEAVHQVTDLPMYMLRLPVDAAGDPDFLAANRVTIRTFTQVVYGAAVRAIHDSLKHLKNGGGLEELRDRQASAELLTAVTRGNEFARWEQMYVRS